MTIRNTATADSMEKLITALPGGIEAQEAEGQRQLCSSSQLPAKGLHDAPLPDGMTVGAPNDSDPLFVPVALPPGWRVEATEHPMWSKLLDANGIERAEIFYKAAFYDRRAFMRWAKEPQP